jgi:hypothetical protein
MFLLSLILITSLLSLILITLLLNPFSYLVLQGISLSFQQHPQLMKVYEQIVSPKYAEISCQYTPKIIKALNTKK